MFNFITSANRPDVVWQQQIETFCEKNFLLPKVALKTKPSTKKYSNDNQRVKQRAKFLSKLQQPGGKIKLRPITHPPQIFQEEAIFWKPE